MSLVLSEKGRLLAEPEVALTGLPAADNSGTPFAEIARDAAIGTIESLPKPEAQGPGAGERGGAPLRPRRRQPGLGQEADMLGAADGALV